MMGYGYNMMGGFGLGALIIGGIIIYIVVVLSKNRGFGLFSQSKAITPLEQLQRRYIDGEITEEAYEKMKNNIL